MTTLNSQTRLLLILIAGVIAASILIAVYTLRKPQAAPDINGILIPHPQQLPAFTLIDHNQQAFTKENLLGKWHFVSYGYTYCPDICPITLSILSNVTDQLTDYAQDTGVLFYSVDPARDTPAQLAKYIAHFNTEFIGTTYVDNGPQHHRPFEKGLGIVYDIPIMDPQGNFYTDEHYPVNHGVMIYLLNPEGNLQAVFTPSFNDKDMFHYSVEQLVEDYRAVRGYIEQ